MDDFQGYPDEELAKQIKHSGWIVGFFLIVGVVMVADISYDFLQGDSVKGNLLILGIILAGVSPTAIRLRRLKLERKRRDHIDHQ